MSKGRASPKTAGMASTLVARAPWLPRVARGARRGMNVATAAHQEQNVEVFVPIAQEEVLRNYRRVANDVAQAAVECGRNPEEVKLVAVTKTHTLEHVLPARTIAGCVNFGENRLEEALQKIERARDLGVDDVNWHYIGTLQSRKAKKLVDSGSFCLVHSVDSFKLARKLSQAADTGDRMVHVLLQVNTSGESSKQGLNPDGWKQAVQEGLLDLPGLSIEGLMTMAPFTNDEDVIRSCFSKLASFRGELQCLAGKGTRHSIKELSMGMSNDYKIAIEEGSTIVRVGTDIFGSRPKP